MTTHPPSPSYWRSGRWVPIVVFAIVMAIACVFLARWQWSRLDDRRATNAIVVANEERSAVAPDALTADLEADPAFDLQWRAVTATGRYLPEGQRVVRQRPLDGANGYYVIAPLALAATGDRTEELLWVVRGWIPSGADARTPSTLPDLPTTDVTVTGLARPWEKPVDEVGLPSGQVQRISPSALLDAVSETPFPFWIQATDESPAPQQIPQRLPQPKISEGPHLGYAIQWVMFSMGALVGGWVLIRRQREYFAEDQAALAQANEGD